MPTIVIIRSLCIALMMLTVQVTRADDGRRLWLRADTTANAKVDANSNGTTAAIAAEELRRQWKGAPVKLHIRKCFLFGFKSDDSYHIRGNSLKGYVISARHEKGLLYAAYHLLRLQETNQLSHKILLNETPKYDVRILNHWDNLNGTVERGYAGRSLWQWHELPEVLSTNYREYARANASVGINGTVLNNVNASTEILKPEYLKKVKALADVFRPYGIRVYLSVNFSSPKVIGGLINSDPLNPQVQQWWKDKAAEIYGLIPDFGGFLVKANSEGQPGPQDYGRTHADGANMLADALKPYKGIVMWRAFVYNPSQEDRARQAYSEFMPLDGEFRDNVIIQVKNGPVDFQPREPFSPLFGAMQKTAIMPELQITQEYLGFSNHLVYLASQWKEFLDSDTYCKGAGSTVSKATDKSLFRHKISAIAGVANTGLDANRTGHHFAQANWYAFGRLAWNHELSAETIADEWIKQTFTLNPAFVEPVKEVMLKSHEAAVNYMMPLGLHHLFAWDHHYGPEPWCFFDWARPDWLPVYYHQASEYGIGFNRTETGSNAVSQYFSPLKEQFSSIENCPEKFLLWFHHVPWNHRMNSGRILWDELCYQYEDGVKSVRQFQEQWNTMKTFVDQARFEHVKSRLEIQLHDAIWWKDACLLYFQTFSKLPIPNDIGAPVHQLEELMKIRLDLKHHN